MQSWCIWLLMGVPPAVWSMWVFFLSVVQAGVPSWSLPFQVEPKERSRGQKVPGPPGLQSYTIVKDFDRLYPGVYMDCVGLGGIVYVCVFCKDIIYCLTLFKCWWFVPYPMYRSDNLTLLHKGRFVTVRTHFQYFLPILINI